MRAMAGIIICGALGFSLAESTLAQCCRSSYQTSSTKQSPGRLTEAESKDLRFMHEEEKLAYDVYNAMHELYGQRVFSNIPRAEQRHMDAILGLLNAYGLESALKRPGKFRSKELQRLYDNLVKRGSESKQEAYLVGALIEEVDIKDLEDALRRTDKADLRAVFENLISGSERHLNAFVRNYEAVSGKSYTAQAVPQAKVDAILGR